MNVLTALPFGLWMYAYLHKISSYQKRIRLYRAEGKLAEEREEIRRVLGVWSGGVNQKVGIEVRASGTENLPGVPAVFVSNHQSYTDIPVLGQVIAPCQQTGFMAKSSLQKLPLYGPWMADIRSVFIQRDDARSSLRAIQEGIELIEQGFSLVLFPEGTRSKGPEMGEFRKGSLRLALKPQVPIVPVTISGSYRCYEEKERPCPGVVKVHIHPPLSTAGLSKLEAAALGDRVEAQIKAKLKELQQEP
ncbi:MAG: lysophospholipid acyltransferase family protein [Bacillota bacterium]|nr:lysophospholipid acyltransferase family protein [Bacillota bacterium]